MGIKLYADSATDLPYSFFEENNVTLVPLNVHIEDEEFEDLINIQPVNVYEEIRAEKKITTSQASPQLLEELFTDLAKSGETGIFVTISSHLSGTYQTAVMVHNHVKEEYPDLDLTIIDSKGVSLGYGMAIQKAAKMIKDGESKEAIIDAIHFHCQNIDALFTVEDLDYLAKGGRLSKTSAFVGGLLNIKPLLQVENGKLIPLEKIRGKKKLLKRMLDLMEERGVDLQSQTVGISHGDDLELALEVKKMIEDRFGVNDFYINMIGSVVASHAGPGTLAIFYLKAKKS